MGGETVGMNLDDLIDDQGNQMIEPGQTEFISSRGSYQVGDRSLDETAEAAPNEDAGGAEGRTVEEGDIYRVIEPGLLASLNSYRGLQLTDFSDLSSPQVTGRDRSLGENSDRRNQ